MNKNVFIGQLRELLTLLGALAFASFTGWESVVGLIVAVASVIWAFAYHEGKEVVFTTIRKVLSLAPGVGVALGYIPEEKAAIVTSMVLPLTAMVWSFMSNGGTPPSGGLKLPVMLLVATLSCMCFPSCVSTPEFYKVNAEPYLDEISKDASEVIMDPSDVTPVGGNQFQFDGQAVIRTDVGDITVSDKGLGGVIVVDQRSGK